MPPPRLTPDGDIGKPLCLQSSVTQLSSVSFLFTVIGILRIFHSDWVDCRGTTCTVIDLINDFTYQ